MYVECHFVNQRVILSGKRYERCRFVNCELVYVGGQVDLVENSFEGCWLSFEGAAADAWEFVAALCRDGAGLRELVAQALGLDRWQVRGERRRDRTRPPHPGGVGPAGTVPWLFRTPVGP